MFKIIFKVISAGKYVVCKWKHATSREGGGKIAGGGGEPRKTCKILNIE
jgi:hypothetical protein